MAAASGNERAAGGIPRRQHQHQQARPVPVLQRPPGYRTPTAPTRPAAESCRSQPQTIRRPAPLPPTFRQVGRGGSRTPRRLCCLCSCSIVVFVLFAMVLAVAFAFLYVQPSYPSFRLQSLRAPRLNVTARSDGSGTYVDADTALRIFASNPNSKIAFSYGNSEAAVFVTGVDETEVYLGSGTMPAFVQMPKNSTVMGYSAAARGQLVADAAGVRMEEGIRSGELTFRAEVKVRVDVWINVGGGRSLRMRVPVRIDCPPATMKRLKGTGRMLPKCGIYWLNKINLH